MNSPINIVQEQISSNRIKNYFIDNKDLLNTLDIDVYSKKISDNAIHFCAYDENILVGFCACYFNDPMRIYAYITSISIIKSHQGKGLATSLLNKCVDYAVDNNFNLIKLEVRIDNLAAISFYDKFNFQRVETSGNSFILEKALN